MLSLIGKDKGTTPISLKARVLGRSVLTRFGYDEAVLGLGDGTARLSDEQANNLLDVLRRASSPREGYNALLRTAGVHVLPQIDERMIEEAIAYEEAYLLAHLGRVEEAAESLARSNVMPSHSAGWLYYEAVQKGVESRKLQDVAIAEGVPSVWLFSLPRAGSSTLASTVGSALGAPVFRISLRFEPTGWAIMPSWARLFAQGGGVLHDHSRADAWNVNLLKEAGVNQVTCLARDPRESSLSASRMFGRPLDEKHWWSAFSRHVRWLESWVSASEDQGITVRWIPFSYVSQGRWSAISACLAETMPKGQRSFRKRMRNVKEFRNNFSGAESANWRDLASPNLLDRLEGSVPERVRMLLTSLEE